MDSKLIEILEQRESTAKAYMEIASRYNIPLEIFGEKISIQPIGSLTKKEQHHTIRQQIIEFLDLKGGDNLAWEELYNRLPDKKLRLAICLELLKDNLTTIESLSQNDIRNKSPNDDIGIHSLANTKNTLLNETWELLEEQRSSEVIYKEWLCSIVRPITKGPWSSNLENLIETTVTNGLKSKEEFVSKAHDLIREAKQWVLNNDQTVKKRIEEVRKSHRDFDPHSQKWQKILIKEIQEEGIDLKKEVNKIKIQKEARDFLDEGLENIMEKEIDEINGGNCSLDKSLLIIGEKHGSKNNSLFLYNILRESKEYGFKSLTIEEPRSSGWAWYVEFAKGLKKTVNNKPNQIEKEAEEFCTKRGITEKSTAQRLTLIHIARTLSYSVHFVDIEEAEKQELTKKRKEKNEQSIIDSPPTDPLRPITALGGPRVFSKSILEVYKDCLYRSKEMSKQIVNISKNSPTIHVGGILHSLDIQEEIYKRTRKLPLILTLGSKKTIDPLTLELGRYPEPNPTKGIYRVDNYLRYDTKLLNSILGTTPLVTKERVQIGTSKQKNFDAQMLLN